MNLFLIDTIKAFFKNQFEAACPQTIGISAPCATTVGVGTAIRIPSMDGGEDVYLWATDGALQSGTKADYDLATSYEIIPATGVVISGCPVGNIAPLATAQLTATVAPVGAVQTGVWSTSDDGVATVSQAGLVTAVADGSATITFTTNDGGFTDTCAITVVT